MTMKSTVRRHRDEGRGRRAFWIGAAIVLGATLAWLAPARAGREERSRHGGWGRDGHGAQRSIGEVAVELRRHAHLLHHYGLNGPQIERIATLIDQSSPALQNYDAAHDLLTARAVDAFTRDTIDPAEINAIEEEAARLAAEVIHESFDLFEGVAAELTPGQRAELIDNWRSRR